LGANIKHVRVQQRAKRNFVPGFQLVYGNKPIVGRWLLETPSPPD